jgi:hypothetical protein
MNDLQRHSRQFKRKARLTYDAAAALARLNPNSAANRAYYCLYQALIGELELRGVRPETIDAGSAQAARGDVALKWTHSFIKRNATLAGLDGRQCDIVRTAYELRRIGDYSEDDVDAGTLHLVLSRIPALLECLGV